MIHVTRPLYSGQCRHRRRRARLYSDKRLSSQEVGRHRAGTGDNLFAISRDTSFYGALCSATRLLDDDGGGPRSAGGAGTGCSRVATSRLELTRRVDVDEQSRATPHSSLLISPLLHVFASLSRFSNTRRGESCRCDRLPASRRVLLSTEWRIA